MNFDIAISRAAVFARAKFTAGASVRPLKGDALYDAFNQQAHAIATHPSLIAANEAIWKRATRLDKTAEKRLCVSNTKDGIGTLAVLNVADEFSGAGDEVGQSEALVARMRSELMELTIAETRWILRTRASVTSCALEGNVRPTKLWWTFEGIPADSDPDRRPTEDQVKALLDATASMERVARDGLRIAYQDTLVPAVKAKGKAKLHLHRERLNITLTECVDDQVDSLLDAMYFDEQQVSDIKASDEDELKEAREGMTAFERFVHCIVGPKARVADSSVYLAEGIPKVKGVIWRGQRDENTIIVGFARRVGAKVGLGLLTPDERRAELTEQRVRLRSAARPLSALLASKQAGMLDARLRQARPS